MITDRPFKITYYADKHKKHITRLGKWVEGCRYWTDNLDKQFALILILRQITLEMQLYRGQ